MQPWTALTAAGQVCRLRTLAQAAIDHYPLAGATVTPLATDTNTLFLVHTPTRRYVLRIHTPNQRSVLEIHSELAWLTALRADTTLIVPHPLPTRTGALVVTVQVPGVPEPRQCVLFDWIGGHTIGERRSPALLTHMGTVLAQLHQHADTFQPPATFSRTRLDTAWTFGRPAVLDRTDAHPLWPARRRQKILAYAAQWSVD